MEGFGNFIKVISGALIMIFIVIIIGVLYKDNSLKKEHLKIINNYEYRINSLNDSISKYNKLFDSIILNYNRHIDSLSDVKQKTITIYEKAELDFSNTLIVDDDSIISFIATKIQD